MAQRSEDGVGKTSEMSRRLERALAVWTRSAISIQASSRDDGCINRPDRRKHLNLRVQISRKPPCIQRGVHTRSFAASFWLPNFCHPFSIAAEKVLSLGPARCLASFQKDDEAAKLLPAH